MPLDFLWSYVASLPRCGQRHHTGHSCVSPSSAARVARGTLLFSPRGVVLSALYPVLLGSGLAPGLVRDGLSAADPTQTCLLDPLASLFRRTARIPSSALSSASARLTVRTDGLPRWETSFRVTQVWLLSGPPGLWPEVVPRRWPVRGRPYTDLPP